MQHVSSAPDAAGTSRAVRTVPDDDHPAFRSFATETRPSRLGVLQFKHYRNILGAQMVSNIGNWSEMFAIQMFVAQTSGKLDDQGVLGVCQQAPIFFLGLMGGLAADRFNRRTLLVVTQVLAAFVASGIALVSMTKFENPRTAIHWLFFLGALHGTVMAFNFPAWQVLTPRLVPKDQLAKAITLNGIQFNLTRVIGPAIAGLVLARWGGTPLLWFNAVSFFLMACVVMTTPNAPPPPKTGHPMIDQIKTAMAFLWRSPGPRAVFFAQVMLSLLAAPLVRLLSNFVIDVYRLDHTAAEKVGGMLLGVQGIGAVAGGFALRLVPPWYPRHHFIPLAVTGLAISISVFALTTSHWWGYAAMAVCGWFWMWAFNQSWAQLQVLVPDNMRGRAMSVANMAIFGATAVGVMFAGFMGELAKEQQVMSAQHATQGSILILSVPLFFAGIVMMVNRVPEVDGMSRLPRRRLAWHNALTAAEHRPKRTPTPTIDEPESVMTGK
jgi:MFS family permease